MQQASSDILRLEELLKQPMSAILLADNYGRDLEYTTDQASKFT